MGFISYYVTGSVIAAVCQVEVVVTVLVTGLIVHFITRKVVKKSIISQGNHVNVGKLVTASKDYYEPRPVNTVSTDHYEPVGLDVSTGDHEDVELQPSPTYQEVPEYM